jgi:hypothetical protein
MPEETFDQPAQTPLSTLAIFSMNTTEIGKVAAMEDVVIISFPDSAGTKELSMPRSQIKAANVTRVGRIGLDTFGEVIKADTPFVDKHFVVKSLGYDYVKHAQG